MPDATQLTAGLAFLVPLGYALIAVSGLPAERARHATVSTLAALGLAALGYVACGFALQFGGVGLTHNLPGLERLIWEWSALGATWGAGWGTAGLVGWGLTGPAATSGAYALALANLPWVVTATLIPVIGLRGRVPAWVAGLLGLLMGGVIYPLAGNWIWGGGWLANLGSNLGQGHGLVDAGGAGLVHLLAASATLAAILVFTTRKPKLPAPAGGMPLPPTPLPLLAFLGAGLLLIGGLAWTATNPLLDPALLDWNRTILNWTLAAGAGALLSLLYTWFVAGAPDPLMAARGLAAGTVAIAAGAPFVPPWAAAVIGVVIGLLVPLVIFVVDHVLRWDDPTAALTIHGLSGALGLLAVGVFADGAAGQGWNNVGANGGDAASYLGIARQGVTGLVATAGYAQDWPGQIQAQLVGGAALALFGLFATWLFLVPPALLLHLIRPRPVATTPAVPVPVEVVQPVESVTSSDVPLVSEPVEVTVATDEDPQPPSDTLANGV